MPTQSSIDFNCDLGEDCGDDTAILPFISSASIACGFHAGSPDTMRRTVALCMANGIAIGAHPSHADRDNFGRIPHAIDAETAYALTLYQTAALDGFVRAAGGRLHHVKPHGALYNQAASDRRLADAIAHAVRDHDAGLVLYALAGSKLIAAGKDLGLRVAHEAFAERRYETDGSLTPRTRADASLESLDDAVAQVGQMLQSGTVNARTGERIPLQADSICLHGDRDDAARFAHALHDAITGMGLDIRTMERGA